MCLEDPTFPEYPKESKDPKHSEYSEEPKDLKDPVHCEDREGPNPSEAPKDLGDPLYPEDPAPCVSCVSSDVLEYDVSQK